MSEIVKIVKITGTALPMRGNEIDTDRIIPARYLKEVSFARMGDYPFFDERYTGDGKKKDHPFNDPEYSGASILFVNKNFGCGSSREHAPQALNRFGIKVIVGESFAAIFAGNCTMMGVPTVTASEKDIQQLMKSVEENPKTEYTVDIDKQDFDLRQGEDRHRPAGNLSHGVYHGIVGLDCAVARQPRPGQTDRQELPYMNDFAG